MDDYCGTAGEITSKQCNNCFDMYVATGATCDPTAGAINTSCMADPQCSAYITCIDGCPQ
jgi:hypothetical protein